MARSDPPERTAVSPSAFFQQMNDLLFAFWLVSATTFAFTHFTPLLFGTSRPFASRRAGPERAQARGRPHPRTASPGGVAPRAARPVAPACTARSGKFSTDLQGCSSTIAIKFNALRIQNLNIFYAKLPNVFNANDNDTAKGFHSIFLSASVHRRTTPRRAKLAFSI